MVKSYLAAAKKEKGQIISVEIRLKKIIFSEEEEKIRAKAAGKIKSAVVKNTPIIGTQVAIIRDNKIRKEIFQNLILTPSIFAKS